jgi:glycosyltransferase involved in cell wall biosynthesis
MRFCGGRYINARLIDFTALLGTLLRIRSAARYDIVFLQRGLPSMTSFPWLEILLRKYSKRLIYDYDDALYLKWRRGKGAVTSKAQEKSLRTIFKMSDHIIAGNRHLADYTGFPNKTTYLPTSIDTNKFCLRGGSSKKESALIIGWTGTSGNYSYLYPLNEVFKKLALEYPRLIIKIISEKEPDRSKLSGATFQYVSWNQEHEVEQLAEIDIGVMYLDRKAWADGKCGFKLIQYMALGKPVVASRVSANVDIVKSGENGFLAESDEDWFSALAALIRSQDLRVKMGAKARVTIEQAYSIEHNSPIFLALLDRLANIKRTKPLKDGTT